MIAHVVMFRPPADISRADREALVEAMRHAVSNIPSIKHVRVGRRRLLGHAYEALMTDHMEYLAVIEFETEADLQAYLAHPAHIDLGQRFFQSAEAALVYDFVLVEPDRVSDLLED